MKITYSERKTINLGNYESKSVEICLENVVNFEKHTVETAYNEIKNFVNAKLEEALKEKPKGTVAKKIKAESTKEIETVKEEFKSAIKEMEIPKEVCGKVLSIITKEELRKVCAALREFNPKYGEAIKNLMHQIDVQGTILEINDKQFLIITDLVNKILEKENIYYNSVSGLLEQKSNDGWSNL